MDGQLIERVREGMDVVDADGQRVGSVADVRMGDPQAVTTRGTERSAGGLWAAPGPPVGGPSGAGAPLPVGIGDREPDAPEPLRAQLLRVGYIKVDGPGLFDGDRYVRADQIASVSGDTVALNIPKSELWREA